ncbi:MAG: MFS transporter, partial [Gemmobacter sp.]|nr:MFS transporter [Gemmobacter sp.]
VARVLRSAPFWMLAGVFALVALNHFMIMSFMVPIFVQQGVGSATAVLAAATVGPAQVAGRLVLMRWESRIGNAAATRVTLLVLILGAVLLALTGLGPQLIFAYVIVQGAAMGVITILRPVLIGDVMGQENYGTIAGAIQIPALVSGAAAPMVAALVLDGPGLYALIGLSLGLSVAALGLLTVLRRVG